MLYNGKYVGTMPVSDTYFGLMFFLSLAIILGNLFCEQEVTYIVESILKKIKISLVSAVKTEKHTAFKYPYSSYLSLLRVETIQRTGNLQGF